MDDEKKCKHCHKPLNTDFHFCPYCGTLSLEEQEHKSYMNSESDDHEKLDRLDVLEACLDVLDTEISNFLATNVH